VPVRFREIAGGSLERLTALSDGIFAVAMTLLVLGLSVQSATGHLQGWQANREVWERLISTYASIAFIVVVQLNAAITPRIWPLDRF
jgi:uncharacterized membrane protein